MEKLAIIMPVYNEEEAIGAVLDKWVQAMDQTGIDYTINPYNDGSKDRSWEVIQEKSKAYPGKVIAHTKANGGHGPTILLGYKEAAEAGYDWVFQIDSDDEMGPEGFPALWAQRNKYDFLVGIRDGRKQALPRKIISLVSRLSVRLFYGKSVWDVNTPYRLMRATAFKDIWSIIPDNTFAPNVIISGMAARNKLRCFETRVPQRDRQTGEVSIKKWKLLKAAAKSFRQTIMFALKQESKAKKIKNLLFLLLSFAFFFGIFFNFLEPQFTFEIIFEKPLPAVGKHPAHGYLNQSYTVALMPERPLVKKNDAHYLLKRSLYQPRFDLQFRTKPHQNKIKELRVNGTVTDPQKLKSGFWGQVSVNAKNEVNFKYSGGVLSFEIPKEIQNGVEWKHIVESAAAALAAALLLGLICYSGIPLPAQPLRYFWIAAGGIIIAAGLIFYFLFLDTIKIEFSFSGPPPNGMTYHSISRWGKNFLITHSFMNNVRYVTCKEIGPSQYSMEVQPTTVGGDLIVEYEHKSACRLENVKIGDIEYNRQELQELLYYDGVHRQDKLLYGETPYTAEKHTIPLNMHDYTGSLNRTKRNLFASVCCGALGSAIIWLLMYFIGKIQKNKCPKNVRKDKETFSESGRHPIQIRSVTPAVPDVHTTMPPKERPIAAATEEAECQEITANTDNSRWNKLCNYGKVMLPFTIFVLLAYHLCRYLLFNAVLKYFSFDGLANLSVAINWASGNGYAFNGQIFNAFITTGPLQLLPLGLAVKFFNYAVWAPSIYLTIQNLLILILTLFFIKRFQLSNTANWYLRCAIIAMIFFFPTWNGSLYLFADAMGEWETYLLIMLGLIFTAKGRNNWEYFFGGLCLAGATNIKSLAILPIAGVGAVYFYLSLRDRNSLKAAIHRILIIISAFIILGVANNAFMLYECGSIKKLLASKQSAKSFFASVQGSGIIEFSKTYFADNWSKNWKMMFGDRISLEYIITLMIMSIAAIKALFFKVREEEKLGIIFLCAATGVWLWWMFCGFVSFRWRYLEMFFLLFYLGCFSLIFAPRWHKRLLFYLCFSILAINCNASYKDFKRKYYDIDKNAVGTQQMVWQRASLDRVIDDSQCFVRQDIHWVNLFLFAPYNVKKFNVKKSLPPQRACLVLFGNTSPSKAETKVFPYKIATIYNEDKTKTVFCSIYCNHKK